MKKMKKYTLFIIFLWTCAIVPIQAQTYTDAIDSIFSHVSKTDAHTGILYERVLSFGHLTHYNSLEDNPDTSNYTHFLTSYSELCRATFCPTMLMMTTDSLKKLIESDTSHIQIGMLHFNFNTFDTIVARQKLYFDNDSVLRENSSDPRSLYKENTLFVASPLIHILTAQSAIFTINSLFYFDNTQDLFRNISIDFDDGLGFRMISLNEDVRVQYSQDGIKTIKFKVSLRNGDSLTAFATLEINTAVSSERSNAYPYTDDFAGNNAINAKIALPNPYIGGEFSKEKGDVRIYYANSDKILRKPILIIDGFDPQNERKFEICTTGGKKSLWEMLKYKNNQGDSTHLGEQLLNMGYDIVLLDFPKGGTYIEENAMVCIEVLNRLNNMLLQNGSNEQIVVVGPSMGGQISRYALAYMENNPTLNTHYGNHNARLWISYDSPHQGANIAMGAQELIKFFANENSESGISNIWNKTLCCPAAKQMLMHHAEVQAYNMFNTYYNNSLHNLNVSTNGYPFNLRKISVANGSINNVPNGIAHQIAFEGTVLLPTDLIVDPFSGLFLPGALVNLQIRNVADSGNKEVLRFNFFYKFIFRPYLLCH